MMPRNVVRAPELWGCNMSLGSHAAVLLMRGKNCRLGWAWSVHREHAEPVLSGGLTKQAKENVGVWSASGPKPNVNETKTRKRSAHHCEYRKYQKGNGG